MKKLTTILILMISVFTGVFAESTYERCDSYMESHLEIKTLEEIQKEDEETLRKMKWDACDSRWFFKGAWKLESIDEVQVKYSRSAVTYTSGKHKCTVYITRDEVYIDGKKPSTYTKEFLLENGKKAYKLHKESK